jgi:serralysin
VENLTLTTGAGNINATGNNLNNVIIGNDGNNILTGGGGIDTLTGGAGADIFVFADGDTGSTAGHRDTITDFLPGTDQIDLTGIDADTTVAGHDAFRFLGTAAFDGTPGALHTIYDAVHNVTVLEGDTNGDKVADFGIELVGNLTLSQSDFTAGSLLLPLTLTATASGQTLTGGALDDTLSDGGFGSVTMIGGLGNDTYVVNNASDVVVENGNTYVAPAGWTVKGTADFNHDGILDVVLAKGSSSEFQLLNASGAVISTVSAISWGPSWTLAGALDNDHDGNTDLLYHLAGTSTMEVDYLNGTSYTGRYLDGTGFTPDAVSNVAGYAAPSGWTVKGTADFNHDGNLDVVLAKGSSSEFQLLNASGAVISTVSAISWGPSWTLEGTLDADHDGNTDLLYQLAGTSTREVDYLNGTSYTGHYLDSTGFAPDALAALPSSNEGTDTVLSSVSYTLPNAVENLTLTTGAGNINATGNNLNNVITSNDGNNILTGGGGADTFVFNPAFGKDTITDFHAGEDIIRFDHTIFADAASVLSHTADDGHGNAIITLDANNTITLQNVTTATLQQHQSDFHIV